MKSLNRIALLPVLAVCIAFTSCESNEVAPTDQLVSQDITRNASSGATVYRDTYQIDFGEEQGWSFASECNDEYLSITDGVWRIQSTIIQNKNKVTIEYHSNISNFKLLNETTGVSYSGSYGNRFTQHYQIPSFYPYQFKESVQIILTTPGRGNNIAIKGNFHISVDANGNVKTYLDNFSSDCQK